MPETIPFDQRSREVKILLAVVVPFAFGAIVGVVLGISAAAYWVLAALAAVGAILAGLEHEDARGASIRSVVAGALFGLGILLAHAVAGTDAKVSLGSFPPFLIVIDGVAGTLLGLLGWRLGRARRDRSGEAQRSP
ncbi:MAG: hypothetical protein H0X42_08370 [Solirubrobacterales bacterium]|nr:hypothetical protein [Solirubrobacterales bacterium]